MSGRNIGRLIGRLATAEGFRATASRRPELAAEEAVVERRRAETALAVDALRPGLDAVVSFDRFGLAGGLNPAASPAPGAPAGTSHRLESGWGDSLDLLRNSGLDDTRVGLVFALLDERGIVVEGNDGNNAGDAAVDTAPEGGPS